MRVPEFPLVGEPGEWDELTLLAATVFLEGEAEPEEGQAAVAFVVMNRVAAGWAPTLMAAILGRDERVHGDARPYEAFSCWNDDYVARAVARLSEAPEESRERAWKAAARAYWRLSLDPSKGACFYLNVAATLALRHGTLPAWAADPHDPRAVNLGKVTEVIGRHTFMRG